MTDRADFIEADFVMRQLSKSSALKLIDLKPPAALLMCRKAHLREIKSGPHESCRGSPPTRHRQQAGMRLVPGGTFRMGSDKYYPEETPVHRATAMVSAVQIVGGFLQT
jgi:formylglycine-generating enzyme required for sulfatase activity